MNIDFFTTLPQTHPVAPMLARFEESFHYPLGNADWFRIHHPDDYPAFFSSMGPGGTFIAHTPTGIVGCLGVAVRPLHIPSLGTKNALYFGDLKTSSGLLAGRMFAGLIKPVWDFARTHNVDCAFGVVMDGTPRTPDRFTGKLGVPGFKPLAKLAILQIQGDPSPSPSTVCQSASPAPLFFPSNTVYAKASPPVNRSIIPATWFSNSAASGRLEDTRRVKRLLTSTGTEMLNAHLADFAYSTVPAGTEVIQSALAAARQLGFTGLFTCVLPSDVPAYSQALSGLNVIHAPATVYGLRIPANLPWLFNTTEI